MYRLLKRVLGIKLGSPQEALYELDSRIESYLTDKYKSDLIIVDNTKDVLNSGYVVDEAWLAPPPDEQPASEWFDACFSGDLSFIRAHFDVFNRKVDDRQFSFD